jgi:hypothetical protein
LESAEFRKLWQDSEDIKNRNGNMPPKGPDKKFQAVDDQTQTPAFKEWFGDSKVVDKEGKPLKVYHGTDADFTKFIQAKEGSVGKGIYVSPSSEIASSYAFESANAEKRNQGSNVKALYVSIKNPIEVSLKDFNNPAEGVLIKLGYTKEKANAIAEKALETKGNITNEIQAKAIAAGFDGIHILEKDGSLLQAVAFKPTQVKSATGNSGEFNPKNPDIRFQDDSEDPNALPFLLPSRYDKVARLGTTGKEVAANLQKFNSEASTLEGKYGNKIVAHLNGYDKDEIANAYKFRHAISNGIEPTNTLTANEQKLKSALDAEFKVVGEDIIASGLEIKDSDDFRKMQLKPEGYQPNIISQKVLHAWQENTVDAPKYDKLYVDYMEKKGLTKEAAAKQLQEYKEAVGNAGVTPDIRFNAVRKAEGKGLPFELVEQNPALAFKRYGRRAASDVAFHKFLQADPRMMKALGLKDQYGKAFTDLDAATQDKAKDVTWIGNSTEVKSALRTVFGVDAPMNQRGNAFLRAVVNSVIGTPAAIRNIAGLGTSYAGYYGVTPSTLKEAFVKRAERASRAFESNAVRTSFKDIDAAGIIEGNPDRFVELADKYSAFMRKWSGRDLSDKFEGELSYSLGETLATQWFAQAKAGDIKARRMLNRFGGNIKGGVKEKFNVKTEVSGDDVMRVAKNFVDATRGSYSAGGLPSSAIEGGAAPMLSLARWSIEKFDTFQKDIVRPITEHGDWAPLAKTTFAGLLTGAAIEKLTEFLSHKKSPDATLEETWANPDVENITAKVIGLLQLGGYGGMLSEMAKAGVATLQGKDLKFNNPVSMPALSLVESIFQNTAHGLEAAQQGEEKLEILSHFIGDILTATYQNYRYGKNWVDKEGTERKGKFRDIRVYNELNHEPAQGGSDSNPYLGFAARDFKRASSLEDAASKLPRALETAVKKAKGNYGELASNVEGLRRNSYQTFPSDPMEAAKYYQYLIKTIGVDKANMRYADYLKQNKVNQIKNTMVPKLKKPYSNRD